MSIAGGYWRAVAAAAEAGCECVQLFTKNNNQWRGKPLTDEEAQQFQEALAQYEIGDPLSHASYLINLASPDDALRQKSIDAMIDELQRAHRLGIPLVVVHPGAFQPGTKVAHPPPSPPSPAKGRHTAPLFAGAEPPLDEPRQRGIERVGRSLRAVLKGASNVTSGLLLENTAGQGSTLGATLGELTAILAAAGDHPHLGVCIDTCHAFAAGYDLTTETGYQSFMSELSASVSLQRVRAIHLNDSKKGLGSRVDRHEHIGMGLIGDAAFCRLLTDPRWAHLPMYLETEKGVHDGESWDVINLRRLRKCFGKVRAPRRLSPVPATPHRPFRGQLKRH